jgi:beta-glucosidase
MRELRYVREDLYLDAARGDDFIGVQSYSSQDVDEHGIVPHPRTPDTTLTGNAYRPDALGIAVRHAWERTGGVPVLVTENGIATDDDTRRIAYTSEALRHLFEAVDEGVDVRGYLHWSAIDNFEWGHWKPTFGLIAFDRETFERRPKPSLAWLGEVARTGRL